RIDRLELLHVSHHDHLGPHLRRLAQEPFELPGAHHSRLVDHQDTAGIELEPLLPLDRPPKLLRMAGVEVPDPFRHRVASDPRAGLESGCGPAGEACSVDGVAVLLENPACGGERRRLAGAGITAY